MAGNRFKKAKKEDEIKTIFSSNTENILEATEVETIKTEPKKDEIKTEILEVNTAINEDKEDKSVKSQIDDEDSLTDGNLTPSIETPITVIEDIEKISDKIGAPVTIKMDKLGVSIKTGSKKRLDKLSVKLRRKPNNVVTLLLDNLYDEETKSFKVDIGKKDTAKITSYHMKKDHINSINKLSKKSGHNKSEIFNILLELALSVEEK